MAKGQLESPMYRLVLRNRNLHLLRGLAIILVVGYHIGLPGFSGGFIGVDIFFLISGFLITMKLSSVKTKSDIKNFYIQRAKKIIPSLFVVAAGTLSVFCYLYGWTDKTARYLSEAVQSLLGVVNNSYMFAATAEPYGYSPFLHLWSIAIEIQFYVAAPLLLFLLVYKFKLNARLIVSAMLLVSLALFVWVSYFDPLAAYYASFGRIWEFSLGALIALALSTHKSRKLFTDVQDKIVQLIALAAILVFSLGFGWFIPEILVYSLFPIFASAALLLVIAKESKSYSFESRSTKMDLFTQPPLKAISFLSDISYPLYLVHYPVLFFTYAYYPEFVFVGVLFSLLSAYLIHRTVEQPLLRNKQKSSE